MIYAFVYVVMVCILQLARVIHIYALYKIDDDGKRIVRKFVFQLPVIVKHAACGHSYLHVSLDHTRQ